MAKEAFRYLHDNDPWMLAEDIPDIDMFFAQIWQSCFTNEFAKPSGRAYKKLLNVQRGLHLWFYFGEQDSYEVGEHIANRIVQNPKFAARVNTQIIVWADKLRAFAEQVPQEHVSKLSNRELWKWYARHDEVHTAYYQWCWIPVGADMFHDNLTNKLKQFLRTRVAEEKINEYLVILTQPRKKSLIQKEQEDFLKLAGYIYKDAGQRKVFRQLYKTFEEKEAAPYGLKTHTPEYEKLLEERTERTKDKIRPAILKKVQQHYQRYFYVKFMWLGKDGVYSFDHYLKELVKLIGRGINPAKELKKVQCELRQQIVKQRALVKKLKIKNPWKQVFVEWGDFMVTKIYRRYAQIYAIYRMQPVLKEIAKRTKLSLKEVRLMLNGEVKQALLQGKISRKSLRERTKLGVYYFEQGQEAVFTGSKAEELVKKAEKSYIQEVQEFQGQVGCVGKATGTVKKIFRTKDMVKMNKGDILVSIATDPDIVPAMKKAAAIVTEQGGVTSHAAIVSRELNIPCVIGTKVATRVLKDGDRVEVDATKGVVKKVKD